MSVSQRGSSAARTLGSGCACVLRSAGLILPCLGLMASSACGVRADSLDGASLSATADPTQVQVKLQVQTLLREVFPKLNEDEIEQLSRNLTIEAALALQV